MSLERTPSSVFIASNCLLIYSLCLHCYLLPFFPLTGFFTDLLWFGPRLSLFATGLLGLLDSGDPPSSLLTLLLLTASVVFLPSSASSPFGGGWSRHFLQLLLILPFHFGLVDLKHSFLFFVLFTMSVSKSEVSSSISTYSSLSSYSSSSSQERVAVST